MEEKSTNQLSPTVFLKPSAQFKPRCEITTVYLEHEGQILLLHRQDHKSEGNKWGIPGGRVEENETLLEALIREVYEETGFDISNQKIEALKTVYIERENYHFVYHAFRTQFKGNPGDVKINFDEHKGFT